MTPTVVTGLHLNSVFLMGGMECQRIIAKETSLSVLIREVVPDRSSNDQVSQFLKEKVKVYERARIFSFSSPFPWRRKDLFTPVIKGKNPRQSLLPFQKHPGKTVLDW